MSCSGSAGAEEVEAAPSSWPGQAEGYPGRRDPSPVLAPASAAAAAVLFALFPSDIIF